MTKRVRIVSLFPLKTNFCPGPSEILEIKPCGLGPRIQDIVVEAFWYKTEIKIIYFVPLSLITFDFDPK